MSRVMRAIIAFLVEEGWPFYRTDSPRHLVIPLPDAKYSSKFLVEVTEELGQVVVFTMAWLTVPPEKRQSINDYLSHVNSTQCSIGSFDFDMYEGLVAYRNGIEVGPAPLTPDLIRPLFARGLSATEKHTPGILNIVNETVTLAQALELIGCGDLSAVTLNRVSGILD